MEERRNEEYTLEDMEQAYRQIQDIEFEEDRKQAMEKRFLDQMYKDTTDPEIHRLIDEKREMMLKFQRERQAIIDDMTQEIKRMREEEERKEQEAENEEY